MADQQEEIQGLSEEEATKRLEEEGYNELPQSRRRSTPLILLGVLQEPMFLLLVACGVIYFTLGDLQEGAMLLFFVLVIIGITVYQERKTENALDSLRNLSSPRALVIREGQERRVAGREVVRGDIVILREGDRVPADGILLSCGHLLVDESLLTGESVPVRKCDAQGLFPEMKDPGGDDQPFVYAGTMVVSGQGIAKIQATGVRTAMGAIGKALEAQEIRSTRLERETERLVGYLAILGLALCTMVAFLYGFTRLDWLGGFLAGLTLAMAILPEEFPVILTVFLALGAWRISQKKVLTRQMPAVEALGAATVLCVDKTGTITQNRMTVRMLYDGDELITLEREDPLQERFHPLVEYGILASQRNPFDPMEQALMRLGEERLARTEHIHGEWEMVQEYPLSRELLAMSMVWRSPEGERFVIASKGAPEAIFDLCHLEKDRVHVLDNRIAQMSEKGMRVLGVAKALFTPRSLPGGQHAFRFTFLGLIGFSDPVRPEVADAIEECNRAGIRVVMITGDYPGTAVYVAQQVGLHTDETILTGEDLRRMDDRDLQDRIGGITIVARVVPTQKLRIVHAFQARGEVVAMTGDGVNDAPALRAADIGIAMGKRGTDVAREASSLVLLEDDFSSIVEAVRLGRRIYDNLKKAIAYVFAIHVPIAGITLLPILFGWPLVLFPVHVVFLELIIDPACSIVFEAEGEERDVMARPPRTSEEGLFDRRTVTTAVLQGAGLLGVLLFLFGTLSFQGLGEDHARAITFTTLVFANLGLILVNRSWSRTILGSLQSPNRALWWVLSGTCIFLAAILYIPSASDLFQLTPLSPSDLFLCLVAGGMTILWSEALLFLAKGRVPQSFR
jgi:Ca2+-transporting ATPase